MRPSAGVACQSREPRQNFKSKPLFYEGGVDCSNSVNQVVISITCYLPVVGIEPATSR